jgi:hypothetical protein
VTGAAVARLAQGASSTHVGQGFDVVVSRTFSPRLDVSGGYAVILPGGFLREATPGARYHSVFLMATVTLTGRR